MLTFTLNHHDTRAEVNTEDKDKIALYYYNARIALDNANTALVSTDRLIQRLRALQRPPQARQQEIARLRARLAELEAAA